jgi:hypothetical protein
MSPFLALIESTELPLNAPDILLICPELQAIIAADCWQSRTREGRRT